MMRKLYFMVRRSGFYTLGLIWDLLRFFLLLLFLLGNSGTSLLNGNFLLLLLGISGQPALYFMWKKGVLGNNEAVTLFACRLPSVFIEFLALVLLFIGKLPGEGDLLFFENFIFPGGAAVLLLLIILLVDFIFQVILLLFREKE